MFKWAGMDYDDFARDVKLRARGSLLVGEYEDLLLVKERLFYWTEDEGYVYNLNRARHKQLTPRQMRVELLKVFRLPASTEELKTLSNFNACMAEINSHEVYESFANSRFFALVRQDANADTKMETLALLAKHFQLNDE